MRLISQTGQLDGSTGRDNRQMTCPLRAIAQYKAGDVPGKWPNDARQRIPTPTVYAIRHLKEVVGRSLHEHEISRRGAGQNR